MYIHLKFALVCWTHWLGATPIKQAIIDFHTACEIKNNFVMWKLMDDVMYSGQFNIIKLGEHLNLHSTR